MVAAGLERPSGGQVIVATHDAEFAAALRATTVQFLTTSQRSRLPAGIREAELSLQANSRVLYHASDTLFVIARRPDAGGPPLAVKRLSATDLPMTVTLDDSNAMAPQFKLSSADRWDVIARVSPMPGGTYVVTLTDFFVPCARINLVTQDGQGCGGPDRGRRCPAERRSAIRTPPGRCRAAA